jgi:hypothetical protein
MVLVISEPLPWANKPWEGKNATTFSKDLTIAVTRWLIRVLTIQSIISGISPTVTFIWGVGGRRVSASFGKDSTLGFPSDI